jgi:hypothetical protein
LNTSRLSRALACGLLVAAATVFAGACDEKLSDLNGPTPNLKPTFASIQSEILTPTCVRCHSGTGRFLPAVLNLTDGNAYASLVGVSSIEKAGLLRVAPGDPENSYIIHKLEGRQGITGARMPLNGTPLTEGQIRTIKRWIETGAAND